MKHFKISIPYDKLLTNTYIINSDLYGNDELTDLINSRVPNPVMIFVNNEDLLNNDDSAACKEIKDCLKETIIDKNIRAVTLINLKVPTLFSKENRLLYLFSLDFPSCEMSCIKSN